MQIVVQGIAGSGALWVEVMKIICGDTSKQSMIDLGCHLAPHTSKLGFWKRTYVDIQERPLDDPEEQQYFVRQDAILYLHVEEEYYDVTIASDFIEHLSEGSGFTLLREMEDNSDKQIIFTPLGPWMLSEDDNPDSHRSAWFPHMLPEYLSIVFLDFHPTLNIGAFFAVKSTPEEMERIEKEIKRKYVK